MPRTFGSADFRNAAGRPDHQRQRVERVSLELHVEVHHQHQPAIHGLMPARGAGDMPYHHRAQHYHADQSELHQITGPGAHREHVLMRHARIPGGGTAAVGAKPLK